MTEKDMLYTETEKVSVQQEQNASEQISEALIEDLETAGTEVEEAGGQTESCSSSFAAENQDHRLDQWMDQSLEKAGTLVKAAGRWTNKAGRVVAVAGKTAIRKMEAIAPEQRRAVKDKIVGFGKICGEKMSVAGDVAASEIDRLDLWLDRKEQRAAATAVNAKTALKTGLNRCNENWKKLLAGAGGIAAAGIVVALLLGIFSAYEYQYNGKTLGVVKNQSDVFEVADLVGDKLSAVYGAEILLNEGGSITFHRVWGTGLDQDSKSDILNSFTYMKDMNAKAYAIVVDGKQVAQLESLNAAKTLLQEIKNKYTGGDESAFESVAFAEDVKIKKIETRLRNIDKQEDALNYIQNGAMETKVYSVAAGDTLSGISKKLGVSQKELIAANPGLEPDTLSIGQELILEQPVGLVSVLTAQICRYTEAIPYEVTYEETATLYKGETTVKLAGQNGSRDVTARVVRCNGTETERTVLNATVLSQPSSQVVLKGTKAVPARIGTGSFIYPTSGKLTSRFGSRWGRMHYGIDLANSIGTSIYAADGGTVVYSGWKRSYGNMIIINHGGNMSTVYAHCSKLLVSTGEKVYQGQRIAKMGNTGNSTGPHLHFEVHVNNVPKNPLNYL